MSVCCGGILGLGESEMGRAELLAALEEDFGAARAEEKAEVRARCAAV